MDFYEILGVSRSATDEEIKKAYRVIARSSHPDLNPNNPDAVEKFKSATVAYEILTDPQKKSQYDALGYVGRRPHPNQRPDPKPKEQSKPKESPKRKSEPKEQDLNNVAECTYFGGTSSGRNILVQLNLTSEEMESGGSKYINIKKRSSCRMCVGDGYGRFPCPYCRANKFAMMVCTFCDYTGTIHSDCPKCKGSGIGDWKVFPIKVTYPAGIQQGHSITIVGEGETSPGKPPGCVRVIII